MNNFFLKRFLIFVYCVLSFLITIAQDSAHVHDPKYYNCIEYLKYRRPPIIQDSTGKYGARLSAAEHLLKAGCDFVGEPYSIVEYYFGRPDIVIDWSKNQFIGKDEVTMKYLLLAPPPGNGSTGMKWLYVDCTKEFRILKFWIYTVDE